MRIVSMDKVKNAFGNSDIIVSYNCGNGNIPGYDLNKDEETKLFAMEVASQFKDKGSNIIYLSVLFDSNNDQPLSSEEKDRIYDEFNGSKLHNIYIAGTSAGNKSFNDVLTNAVFVDMVGKAAIAVGAVPFFNGEDISEKYANTISDDMGKKNK